jgi:ubiquinone/menaquinone biosynthesis C-methylase UbiE
MEGKDACTMGKDERIFSYFAVERSVLSRLPPGAQILDLGCSDGSHMGRLGSAGRVFGVDLSIRLLSEASRVAPVSAAEGERLPFRSNSFDLVYVSHVLHHAADHRAVLREIHRVLKPGGVAFVIETCEDSPIMRLARTMRPEWDSVPVRSRFRFGDLVSDLRRSGFAIESTEQFNVLYWVWAFARSRFRPLEGLRRLAIRAELVAVRRLRRYGAYGFAIAVKPPPA